MIRAVDWSTEKAGKSTLFNNLTGMNTFSADKLFATLDPIHRKIQLKNKRQSFLKQNLQILHQ